MKICTRVVTQAVLLVGLVVSASMLTSSFWQGRTEKPLDPAPITISATMTVAEFGRANNLANPVLKEIFPLNTRQDLARPVTDYFTAPEMLVQKVKQRATLEAEHHSKDWRKIALKFGLWFCFLAVVFYLLRRGRIKPGTRKILYLEAVVIFGIILGSDPSPMGTVKDAIALYGSAGVIFPPRMIALGVFLLLVLLANKFICAWGCQFGTLQDLLFRINRNHQDTRGIIRQYKPPFAVTNTIRLIFFAIFTVVALAWATDIVELIDPFKIYKPAVVTAGGWLFITAILAASLVIYRPWCQLFCPFGLIGWMVERRSIFKIKVDYPTCTGCEACAKACPSTVMNAVLKQEQAIPDCFACGTCINACPTGSIRIETGKRLPPPPGKFEKKTTRHTLLQP